MIINRVTLVAPMFFLLALGFGVVANAQYLISTKAGFVNRVELVRGDRFQLTRHRGAGGGAPPVVGRALEEPISTVVGEDQSIVLEGPQHDLRGRAETRDVETRP